MASDFTRIINSVARSIKGEEPSLIAKMVNYNGDLGDFGEYLTNFALTNNNLSGRLRVFRNLYIPYRGDTTEIDLIMLHEKGIFVFESKNYSGWIFGSEDQLNWTQSLPGGVKKRFYNPIKQNNTHVKALSKAIGVPAGDMTSFVIFSERCELKDVSYSSPNLYVLKRPDMLRKLRSILDTSATRYYAAEFDRLENSLASYLVKTNNIKTEHISNIQQKFDSDKCPFCGGQLVLRKGRYGDFYGCSSYPKCRYTRKT